MESSAVAKDCLQFLEEKSLLPSEGLGTVEDEVKNVDNVATSVVFATSLFLL